MSLFDRELIAKCEASSMENFSRDFISLFEFSMSFNLYLISDTAVVYIDNLCNVIIVSC